MNLRILAPLLSLALAVPSPAATLASALLRTPVAVGPAGHVECTVTNFGSSAVRVRAVAMFDLSGAPLDVPQPACVAEPLAPGATCFVASSAGVSAAAARFDVQGGTKSLRGACKLVENQTVHDESELR